VTQAVFLDRDGVINQLAFFPDFGLIDSPLNPDQFNLILGAAEAIKTFNKLGLKVIVISNQPAIAKGKMTMELFYAIQQKMYTLLQKGGAHLDDEFYCFHHPHASKYKYKVVCDCRKPKPGLILQAKAKWGLNPSDCYMVGDGLTDIQAGYDAGCKTILIGEPKCDLCRQMSSMAAHPNHIFPNLLEASKFIEKEVNEKWKYSLIQQV
jgi:D,D-heptose 1,7-bisphosphate phosphatase